MHKDAVTGNPSHVQPDEAANKAHAVTLDVNQDKNAEKTRVENHAEPAMHVHPVKRTNVYAIMHAVAPL